MSNDAVGESFERHDTFVNNTLRLHDTIYFGIPVSVKTFVTILNCFLIVIVASCFVGVSAQTQVSDASLILCSDPNSNLWLAADAMVRSDFSTAEGLTSSWRCQGGDCGEVNARLKRECRLCAWKPDRNLDEVFREYNATIFMGPRLPIALLHLTTSTLLIGAMPLLPEWSLQVSAAECCIDIAGL